MAADLRSALSRSPGLASKGEGAVLAAVKREAEIRRSPKLRAERFVQDWRKLEGQRQALRGSEHDGPRKEVEERMKGLARGLERDPQLASLLRGRRQELGLNQAKSQVQKIGDDLAKALTRGRGRGLEL